MKLDYALITALIVVAVIFGAGAMGRGLQSVFNTAAGAIASDAGETGAGTETGTGSGKGAGKRSGVAGS